MDVLYGLHPVEEALKAGRRRFDHVLVARERHDVRLSRLVAACRHAGVRVRQESRDQLTQIAGTPTHQGVVAVVRPQELLSLEDLFEPSAAPTRLASVLALDGVEDPQNLGALLRVADGAGVDGIVLTERRSAPLSPVAVKASAGAAEHLRIARVVNLVRALEELKRQNLWIIGLDERGATDYDHFDFTGDCVLVLGREGAGLHDLVRRTCDHLLRIPMAGGVSSLNVSTAGAVVLYEAARQRRAAAQRATPPVQESAARKKKGLVHEVVVSRGAGCRSAFCASFAAWLEHQHKIRHQRRPQHRSRRLRLGLPLPSGKVIFSRSVDANGNTTTTVGPAAQTIAATSEPTATDAERLAVTFTALDLEVHLQTAAHQIAVRANVTVRNDGKTPLTRIPLQLSSSLNWERVRVAGHNVAFPVATLNSDTDHTGQLHEAAIPLATPLAPGSTISSSTSSTPAQLFPIAQRLLDPRHP